MTINIADNDPRISYTVAQGVTQTSFAVPFEFFAASDLNVYVDGTQKILTTDYTVSGGDGSTGTVTISVTGATGGSTVVFTRSITQERTTDFPTSGPFNIASLNTELDRITAIAADLQDSVDRSLQLIDYDTGADTQVPLLADRKGTVLGFNLTTGAAEAGPQISDVQSLADVSADIATLADIEDGTEATDAISGLAAIKANVTTVAGIASSVPTVAGIASNVTTVAGIASNVTTVAGISTNVSQVGPIAADVTTVAGVTADVTTVAGQINNNNLQTIAADIAAVITTANDLNEATSEIDTVANAIANVDIVGGAISNVNTVAGDSTDIGTLAGISADIEALADIEDGTTATEAISTAAANVTSINNFANRYRIGATNPSVDNDEGDLFFNTATNQMLVYNSGVWTEVGSNVPATLSVFEFTATADQTVFTGSDSNGVTLDYSTTNFFVALNGVIIAPEDYTATSSSTLTLDTGANLNDTITIYSFTAFTTVNAYIANNSGEVEISKTDDAATAGPTINLKRDSATPVDDDLLGEIKFDGKNDADQDVTYASIKSIADDVSDGSEDGTLRITPTIGGTTTHNKYYDFGPNFELGDAQAIKTLDIGSGNYTGTLDWETSGVQNGGVRLPLANGTVGHLAFDHIRLDTTNVDDIYFGGISGLPDDVFQQYEVHFSCQPQVADTLVMTFQGETGGEITTGYSYRVIESSTSSTSTSASQMNLTSANVGTLNHYGVNGKITINGFDHDGSNFEMPPNIFGQFNMWDSSGVFRNGYIGATLNSYADIKGFRFKWLSGNDFRRADFRLYGLKNDR